MKDKEIDDPTTAIKLKKGRVKLYFYNDEWSRVIYQEHNLYIRSEFLSRENPELEE